MGFVFGVAAYHSRFCLRAATAEVAEGILGPRLAIWLVAFLVALTSVQLFVLQGVLDVSTARQLAATGSLSLAALIGAFVFGAMRQVRTSELIAAAGVGFAVAVGWLVTFAIANASFEVIEMQSITFTGPSTDTLMALVNKRDLPLSFGLGLVPGVFGGALLTALIKGEARIQRFGPDVPMERYMIGGVLMGFGSMLAGGCAVGAGVSGGAILALTAWVAVFCMWVGAVLTQLILGSRPSGQTAAT